MWSKAPATPGHRASEPLARVLAWRANALPVRTVQSGIVAALALWVTHGSAMVWLWLGVATAAGGVDSLISRFALARAATRTNLALACAGHLISAISFLSIVFVLLEAPTPERLAASCLLLCAMGLNNAMMTGGSPLATAVLVGPPTSALAAAPALARLAGMGLGLEDTVLLGAAGIIYAIFIVRLAATMAAEGEAMRRAKDEQANLAQTALAMQAEAMASKRRWRMIFDQSALPRVCFDASQLYEQAMAERIGEEPISAVLRRLVGGKAEFFAGLSLVEANQAALDICGGDPREVRFPEDFLKVFCQALDEIGADGLLPSFETTLTRASGDRIDIQVHLRIAPDQAPPWSMWLVTLVDMTAVNDMARDQAEARRDAEIANRAKGEFLSVIGHEIRTPLNGVLGMAQAMAFEPLEAKQRQRLDVIRDCGVSLLGLIDDLLELAELESGEIHLAELEFDLRAVFRGIEAAYVHDVERKGLKFELSFDPSVGGVYIGDSNRVRQIACHLISNAIKFTDAGQVAVSVRDEDGTLVFQVRDTGIGMDAARLEALFDSFVQGDSSATRKHGGSGLGLAVASQLTKAMGGVIGADSTPGKGSVFEVRLPLARACRARKEQAAERPQALRVLAAEDNTVNQIVLRSLLAHFGVEPTLVDDGEQALQAWADGPWDVILMDVQMPVMDGLTATKEIRRREAETGRARTPILAVTANAMAHQIDAYRAAGMDDVIAKPISACDLYGALSTILGGD